MYKTDVIRREDIWDSLMELGGNEILEEYCLAIALTELLEKNGITISQRDIDQEEAYLFSLTTN